MEFLKTKGRCIVDEKGKEVLLKGYGIGNWMVQEGFLFGSSEFSTDLKPFMRAGEMDRGRSIDQILVELCGKEYAESFWKRYYRNYFSEKDIQYLAELGFNSVRLPLSARAFRKECPGVEYDEETFRILDEIIGWCEQYGLYVILDMHAAAGGQSGIPCDDGVDNIPHLFTDEESWERTVLLWEDLARRYADQAAVAGYELLNEPLALQRWDRYIPDLIRFYEETIKRIRRWDKKHIFFLQGHRLASRTDIFDRVYDPEYHNWVMTMHLYEVLPDMGVLGPILATSEKLDVPVWMGETGGNEAYMTVLYEMLYENHIGVNVWCQKGEEHADAATLCTYSLPDGFEKIRSYAQEGGAKPGYESSMQIFDRLLEQIRFENCTFHPEFADAILRRRDVTVPAVGYDMLPGYGNSFYGTYPYCVFCGYRREDRMHIVYEPDFVPYESPQYAFAACRRTPKYGDWTHLELVMDKQEFACYTIRQIRQDTKVYLVCRTGESCSIRVTVRGETKILYLKPSAELQVIPAAVIEKGEDTSVKVECEDGRLILRSVIFSEKSDKMQRIIV